jgi:hypothetical protein
MQPSLFPGFAWYRVFGWVTDEGDFDNFVGLNHEVGQRSWA